mgnify:CR=1 FL=1
MKNVSIKAQLIFFALLVILASGTAAVVKYVSVTTAMHEFDIYSKKVFTMIYAVLYS